LLQPVVHFHKPESLLQHIHIQNFHLLLTPPGLENMPSQTVSCAHTLAHAHCLPTLCACSPPPARSLFPPRTCWPCSQPSHLGLLWSYALHLLCIHGALTRHTVMSSSQM
jgi:hypothetical protein